MAENNSIKARQYQLELVDHLCEENGILYLPTGAGKTFVSILVLRRLSSATQYPLSKGGKRTVYMCNTVELARQQCIEIRKCVNLKVGLYIGDRGVDTWNLEEWKSEFEENQVLVGTAQVFVDCVAQNFIKVTDFNLVIIDECHHATRRHPMHTFLSLVQDVKKTEQPRIFGLTDVLIKGNTLDNITEELINLEAAFSGKIVTVQSNEEFANVMLYSTKTREHLIVYNISDSMFPIESKIEAIVDKWKNVVNCFDTGIVGIHLTKSLPKHQEPNEKKVVMNLIDEFLYHIKDFGLYLASIAITLCIIELELNKRLVQSHEDLQNLYRYSITQCEHIKHLLVKEFKTSLMEHDTSMSHIADSMCDTKEIIMKYSSPKMLCFLNTLKEFFKGKDAKEITCLVFVQRRFSAQCIYHVLLNYLKQCDELKDIIIPQYIVGRQNISCSTQSILHNKWNTNIMQQFRKKECNLIICSNVLEEGIDVQACNYVFILDELSTFNSYIQTKGRARSPVATYAIFCNELNLVSTAEKITTYKAAHENIRQFLMERILTNDGPNTIEISQHFLPKIPPYKTSSGAHLVAPLAISILNRYCHSLPWDIFGGVLPWFYKVPTKFGFQVALQLPLQSRLKETIRSDLMQNAKEAKISAAFKACVKLYELGELNDHLLPISERECIEKASERFFQNWKKYTDDGLRSKQLIGKNHVRLYNTQCPDELYDALPKVGQKCYAYSIKFFVEFQANNYNAHVVSYLNSKATFAFLLRRSLPKLAEMPLFMSQGKLRVKISKEPIECMIDNDEKLERLVKFHVMLFRDLLKLWQEFFVIDRRNKENSYLIVPMSSLKCIDWNLVENCQRLLPLPSYTLNERNQKIFRPEDFVGKVISKSYSNMPHENYAVIRVRHDLNPMSPFVKSQYANYVQFYKMRHNVDVTNEKQFLLEVKAFTTRRNFFINSLGKSVEIKRELSDTILIPELCVRYDFPANLWLKALFLPTIIHRVYYMLHAEALRQKINKYLDLDKYFSQYEPNALIVDASLKRAVDEGGRIVEDKEVQTNTSSKMGITDCEKQNLDAINVPWNEYMEPMDCVNQTIDTLILENNYYNKFMNDLPFDMQNLKIKHEEIWSKSQLELPSRNNLIVKTPADITQGTLNTDKYYLDILERSFKNASDLQSAEQHEFLSAITTASVSDVFDMERFELLGDAFLKISVCLYLVNRYPEWNEGNLSVVKGRVVSNQNLLYCMLNTDICNRVCGSLFAPHNSWLPPLISLPSNLLKLLTNTNWPFIAHKHRRNFQKLQLTEEEICIGACYPAKYVTFLKSCQNTKNEENIQNEEMNVNLESDMNKFVYKEAYRDKVMADTLEAILGVCVKNYGICRSFKMLEFFGIVKPDPDLPLNCLLDLKFDFSHLRFNVKREEIDGFLINGHILEENLGYKFHDRAYLLQAITHPSNPTNRLTGSYQELEFIGDAILDMLITCYIFERNQHMTPGMMTDMRMALVNNITLGCVCVRHRFHLFMLYENAALSEAIKKFADFQETQNYSFTDQVRILMEEETNNNLYDEEESLIDSSTNNAPNDVTQYVKDKKSFNLSENVDAPKALGDVVEALIAAVYLDSRDLRITWRIVYNLLEPEIIEFSNQVPKDPVRQLNEHTLANASFSKPVRDNEVFMVKCVFTCTNKTVEVDGFGSNAKHAKKAAAKHALRILNQVTNC